MLRREHRTRRHGLRSVGGWLPACAGWLAALSFLTVSCINEYPGEEPSEVSVGSGLALRVSLLDAEGYGDGEGDDLLPPVECMHDLRVIITHKDEDENEVLEYNRHIDFDDPDYAGKYRYGYLDNANLLFKVREGTPMKKHLYLFSNSEPVLKKVCEAAGLSKHPDPEEGVYGGNHYVDVSQDDVKRYLAALRDATFTQEELDGFVRSGDNGKANGIPMSAEYDVEVEPGNTGVSGLCVIGDLHLVRACNKITFEYENYRPQYPIFVQDWALKLVAKDAYLLPRVPADDENIRLFGTGTEYKGDWIAWYSDHIRTGGHVDELNFEVPETSYDSYNGRSEGETYADLSVTEVKPDGSETVFKEHVTGLRVGNLYWNKTDIAIPGKKTDGKVYYFPETRYIPTDSDKQKYTMSFRTMEYNASASGSEGQHWSGEHLYESGPMENVSTLFRNTHVQIRATFMEGEQVDLNVSIINWGENNPVYGTLTPGN